MINNKIGIFSFGYNSYEGDYVREIFFFDIEEQKKYGGYEDNNCFEEYLGGFERIEKYGEQLIFISYNFLSFYKIENNKLIYIKRISREINKLGYVFSFNNKNIYDVKNNLKIEEKEFEKVEEIKY